ncbi:MULTISPECIES: hypothetical protein [unclassified Streptomyces]|uniref:hypothetical protein n=1 Tax=unclassified Streptomyces TaxID=2593676 RepID=UPI00131473DE|nr:MULTISPECIES: hypothetical protein [unclassified Streptomyces]
MDDTLAVAVTVIPPAEAEAWFGPHVVGVGVTHSHIGTPTVYLPSGLGLAIAGPARSMLSTARCASTAGSTAASGGVCDQKASPMVSVVPVPGPLLTQGLT